MAFNVLKFQREVLRGCASQLGLQGDVDEYNAFYELFRKARAWEKDHHDEIDDKIASRVRAIKLICDAVPPGRPAEDVVVPERRFPDPMRPGRTFVDRSIEGMRHVRRRDVRDSYVIFSDHHIFDANSRQDFFSPHNKALYLDILTNHYARQNWHLVENGDLEELLIHEPDMAELEADGGTKEWDWPKIFDYRAQKIRAQLRLIVADNRDYYDAIWTGFAARGRYHKIVGNHDVALMDHDLMDIIRQMTGYAFDTPSEVMLLSQPGRHRYCICHGHQFDHSCTPDIAPYLGETFSQSGAWAFEGPDRTWKWPENVDFLQDMLDGRRPVLNELVGIDPRSLTPLQIAALAGVAVLYGTAGTVLTAARATTALTATFTIVDPEWFFEGVTGKNIAMEYFASRNSAGIAEEIGSGRRWFKFRHMDEITLSDFLDDTAIWGETTPPTVVLGHSHEPRLRARHPDDNHIHARYINSGAAGRFQNLIWAVEVVRGTARMVSWHYPDNDRSELPVRTEWTPRTVSGQRRLVPGDPEPMAERAQNVDFAPILNVMMAD